MISTLQQDQNDKSFIHSNVLFHFLYSVGNNQCYLPVVLPGATSGLPLVVLNALNHGNSAKQK